MELDSTAVIETFTNFMSLIPVDLYDELVHHPFEDITVKPTKANSDDTGARTVWSQATTTTPQRSKSVGRPHPEVKTFHSGEVLSRVL